jgi:hypothetical protein
MAKIFWITGCLRVLTVTLLLAAFAQAQSTSSPNYGPAAAPQTVEDLLHQMSDQAEVIFIGQVAGIRPHDEGSATPGFIEIDFRVTQAIRGCAPGGTYILREWAGLWAGNAGRYRTGERLLMMLHAPGPSGMSSPVGGMDGAIPLHEMRSGSTPTGDASASLPVSASQSVSVADLRWLGAKLSHPVSYRLQSALAATPLTLPQQMESPSAKAPAGEAITDPITLAGDSSNGASIPVQQASVDALVRLLLSWQKATPDVP